MLGNAQNVIQRSYQQASGKHLLRYWDEFRYRFNHLYKSAAVLPHLGWPAVPMPPPDYLRTSAVAIAKCSAGH